MANQINVWQITPINLKTSGEVVLIHFKGTFLQAVEFARLVCEKADIIAINSDL